MTSSRTGTLRRSMGQWDLTALTVNALIASAIYFMPGTIAGLTGPWSPYAHIACVLVTLTFVLSFAEVASRFNAAGGPYLYAYEAYGKFAGFQIGWIAYLTRLAAVAANYNLFIIYFSYFFPSASSGLVRASVLFLLIALLTVINIRGVKYGAWTVDFITVIKLIPLFVVIGVGLFSIQRSNLELSAFPGSDNVIRSIFLLSFAYGGFEIVTIPSGESIDPQRHVPKALIAALFIAMAIFVGMQVVGVGALPSFASAERPIGAIAESLLGAFGGSLVAFGALVSTFGYFSGSILSVPRLTFALSERRQLPKFFAAVHPKFNTPYLSIITYSSIAFLLAVSSNFITLAAISVVSRLLYYLTTCGAVLTFRQRSRAPFTLWFGPLIPLLGICFACILLFYTRLEEVYFAAGGIAVGTALYVIVQRVYGRAPQAE